MSERCKYVLAWIGPCGKPAEGDFCIKHTGEPCVSCKEQATHECAHTGQFVCGFPLCDKCQGWNDQSEPSGAWGFMNHSHRRKPEFACDAPPASLSPENNHD